MNNTPIKEHFGNWTTQSDGEFMQDPAVGQDPISVAVDPIRRAWNISASKRYLWVPGEGHYEKYLLCYTEPLNTTHNKAETCCVHKSYGLEANITLHNRKIAVARLKNFKIAISTISKDTTATPHVPIRSC